MSRDEGKLRAFRVVWLARQVPIRI